MIASLRHALVIVCVLFTASAACASDAVFQKPATPTELKRLAAGATGPLASARVVRGDFSQQRFLRELPRPLVSSGQFLYARDVGIEWRTAQPFESQFVLTPAGIAQRTAGGSELKLEADQQPALRVVARVFFALFALDLSALANDFETFGERRGNQWVIGLKPRAAALANVFREAVITGSNTVESVVLTDALGDRSVIALQGVRYEAAALTPTERARF
jgi:hypothetical protein